MPRLKSAIKRVEITKRNRIRNIAYKTRIKNLLKSVKEAISKKDIALSKTLINETFSVIDRACTKNVIHKNNAARKKSKISHLLKTIESAS